MATDSDTKRAVLDHISSFVDAVNEGNSEVALAHLSPDVTVVEDLAPFRWHGINAGADWLRAMGDNAQRAGITAIAMELGIAMRVEIEDDSGYAVIPGLLIYETKSATLRSNGLLTFSLSRMHEAWQINAFAWSGPEATP